MSEKKGFLGSLRSFIGGAPDSKAPSAPSGPSAKTKLTAPLPGARTAPLEKPELTPEEKAEESKKRMGFIVTYMRTPDALPEFKDAKFVYKVVSDERSYQTELVEKLQIELRRLTFSWSGDPEDETFLAQREELENRIQGIRDRLSQLFLLLKHLTGVKGKTGGTGFLPNSPDGI